jgi:uncharacterized RDD family membrane protein YckC
VTDFRASAFPRLDWGVPDPAAAPELYDGVLWRRVAAYIVDLVCIGMICAAAWVVFGILTLLSFGLLGPALWFLFALIPLAYHTFLIAGPRSATVGMRLFDVEMRSWDGERPMFLQALAQTALFYVMVGATCSLILLFALFNRRRRNLHDVLSGLVAVRTAPRWNGLARGSFSWSPSGI